MLGISSVTEQLNVIRGKPPSGIAEIHFSIVSAARLLVIYRREAATLAVRSMAATAAPAVGSMRSKRMAEFIYEIELRRSKTVGTARSTLRRLLASLLFWLSSEEDSAEKKSRKAPGGGGIGLQHHRPHVYGKPPRLIAEHEKTALRQFQVTAQREIYVREGDAVGHGPLKIC